MKNLLLQFSKYSIVGIINLGFTFTIYWFLLKIILAHYNIALTVSWAMGVVLTYVINFTWVFKPEEKIEFRKRFWKYVTVYIVSYGMNILVLDYLVVSMGYDPLYMQFLIIPLIVLINFTGIKYWVMK
ncbi:MAG: GtrA family protein [Saprospiraceae bacterium]|nr:GtrA family protein [Saprospiraceae bacterium]